MSKCITGEPHPRGVHKDDCKVCRSAPKREWRSMAPAEQVKTEPGCVSSWRVG